MNQIEESKLVAFVEPEMSTGISNGWYKEVKSANLNQICITDDSLVPTNCTFLNSMNQEIKPGEGKTFVREPFSKDVFIESHRDLLKQLEIRRWEHYAEMAHLLGAKSIKRITNEKNTDKSKTTVNTSASAYGSEGSYESSLLSEESMEFNRTFDNAVPYDKKQYDKACRYVEEHHLSNDPDFFSLLNSRNPDNTKAVKWNYKYSFRSSAQSTLELAINLDGLSSFLKIASPIGQLIPSGVNVNRVREVIRSKDIELEIEFND